MRNIRTDYLGELCSLIAGYNVKATQLRLWPHSVAANERASERTNERAHNTPSNIRTPRGRGGGGREGGLEETYGPGHRRREPPRPRRLSPSTGLLGNGRGAYANDYAPSLSLPLLGIHYVP